MCARGFGGVNLRQLYYFALRVRSKNTRRVGKAQFVSTLEKESHPTRRVLWYQIKN